MLEHCESAKERWGGVSDIIDRWLQERQDLLVHFCSIPQQDTPVDELQKLCQLLVDYVSAGHFEVYDQLVKEGREFDDDAALQEAGGLFKIIDQSTQQALDFNDLHLGATSTSSIQSELSELGEMLANRFEAEDRMIEVLHLSHKNLVEE